MKIEVHKLRINVKSLAFEARAIRQELSRVRDADTKGYLSYHRMSRLRPEARLAHLALAFVKGTPYKVAEQKTKNPIAPYDLLRKLNRFSDSVRIENVVEWLGAA